MKIECILLSTNTVSTMARYPQISWPKMLDARSRIVLCRQSFMHETIVLLNCQLTLGGESAEHNLTQPRRLEVGKAQLFSTNAFSLNILTTFTAVYSQSIVNTNNFFKDFYQRKQLSRE